MSSLVGYASSGYTSVVLFVSNDIVGRVNPASLSGSASDAASRIWDDFERHMPLRASGNPPSEGEFSIQRKIESNERLWETHKLNYQLIGLVASFRRELKGILPFSRDSKGGQDLAYFGNTLIPAGAKSRTNPTESRTWYRRAHKALMVERYQKIARKELYSG